MSHNPVKILPMIVLYLIMSPLATLAFELCAVGDTGLKPGGYEARYVLCWSYRYRGTNVTP